MTRRPRLRKEEKRYLWYLKAPERVFPPLASFLAPTRLFFKIIAYSALPAMVVAFFTLFHHSSAYYHDIKHLLGSVPFLINHGLNLLFANLTAKFAQGLLMAHFGAKVSKFGFILAMNFLPRFYTERKNIFGMNRRQQLWCFATPLVSRLVVALWGWALWYATRGTGTSFSVYVLLLAQCSFYDFLFDGFPLWRGDGYFFMAAYFRLPQNFGQRSRLLWKMVLTGKPLPKELSKRRRTALLFFYPASIVGSLFLIGTIILHVGEGLDLTFPKIFGRASFVIVIFLLLVLALHRPVRRLLFANRKAPAAR